MTDSLLLRNSAAIFEKSQVVMKHLLTKLAETGVYPKSEGIRPCDNSLYKIKTFKPLVNYVISVLGSLFFKKFTDLLFSARVKR